MIDFNAVIYIISNAVLMLAIVRFMKVFFEKRRTPLIVSIASYLIWLVATSTVFLVFNIPLVSLFAALGSLFLITLNYESKLPKKILSVAIVYFYIIIADIATLAAFGYILLSPLEIFGHGEALAFAINAILVYLGSALVQNFTNIRKNNPTPPMFWISATVVPISSIFIAILIMSTQPLQQIWIIIAIAAIFIINLLTFYLHDWLSEAFSYKMELSLQKQEKKYYEAHSELMYKFVEEMKSARHDIKNHLLVLRECAQQNKNEEGIKYIDKLVEDIGEIEMFSSTGITALDSIINYKLKVAKDLGANVDAKCFVPADINIEITDVVVILGNILDNAVEALKKAEDKRISLDVKYSKGRLLIFAKNSFDGNILLDGKRQIFSSSRDENRGRGLANIKRAAERFSGEVEINFKDNLFSVSILLFVKVPSSLQKKSM